MNVSDARVLVTGGSGFLAGHVVDALGRRGCRNIFVVRKAQHDLTHEPDVRRLFQETKSDVVIHLAAVVGGIGANRESPGRFFYENVMMGALTMEQARLAGVKKFVGVGTICAYPKHAPIPFLERDLWNGYPEETNAPYGIAKKMLRVHGQAYREQYGFDARAPRIRLRGDHGFSQWSGPHDRVVQGGARKDHRHDGVRICFFNRSYWPDQAATGQLLTELAQDLVTGYGCTVSVVAGRALHAGHSASSEASGGGWFRPVTREEHEGVRILRANGTRLARRKFVGR